ncbi:hypothetical protein FSARC_11726 [Fusarium sarcochroum]|uniref:Short chain type dehydrogenase n=1 Tax=Fusarium sarcochroum TaxID=1208366 RepID=A0A8H4TDH4_9HYPO|nr:hypothetical protein FSARC_11726 [Fusarium sarcochroum]
MTSRVALIFGAGANIGASVSKAFKAKGYKIALASRSQKPENSTADELHIPMDCADTDSVSQTFVKVRSVFGQPNVVIYNTYAGVNNNPNDVFEVPLDFFKWSGAVNIFGAYAAAQEAVKGWQEFPRSSKPTFIFTGNCANVAPFPSIMTLGVGKAGAAAFVEVAATAYKDKGYKFYYADERLKDGSPMWTGLSGEGHAKLYTELAEGTEQLDWQQTFVTGVGYVKF